MIVNRNTKTYNISAKISQGEYNKAHNYIQKKINNHCKKHPTEAFSVRILFGDTNKDWNNTPLQVFYDYFANSKTSNNPKKQAARDVGLILKKIISSDKRKFIYVGKDTGNKYKLK